MLKITVNNSPEVVSSKSPLIFLKCTLERHWSEELRHFITEYIWKSTNPGFKSEIAFDSLSVNANYVMVVPNDVDHFNKIINREIDELTFDVHPVSSSSVADTTYIFNQVIYRHTTSPNVYTTMELLWFLNFNAINVDILEKTISRFDPDSATILIHYIKECSICLSYPKQEKIKTFLCKHGGYNIYYPSFLVEALSESLPDEPYTTLRCNLFVVISLLLGLTISDRHNVKEVKNSTNPLLLLRKWLNDETFVYTDFSFIERIISFLSPDAQLLVVKRYFLSVRNGDCDYNPEFLSGISENRYHRFQTYRNSIFSPTQAPNLTMPLLIDCVNTYISTDGAALQRFDGILDKYIHNADPLYVKSNISFGNLLPTCNGGAIYNRINFKGFIDFHITFVIRKFENRNEQTKAITAFLDRHFKRVRISDCTDRFVNHYKYCSECENPESSCGMFKRGKYCSGCDNMSTEVLKRWIVPLNHPKREIIKKLISGDCSMSEKNTFLTLFMIDTDSFVMRLNEYISKNASDDYTFFHVSYLQKNLLTTFSEFITLLSMKFWIRDNVYFGRNVLNLNGNDDDNYNSEMVMSEKNILRKLVRETLEKEFGATFDDSGCLEVKYDEAKLEKALLKYYYAPPTVDEKMDVPFLVKQSFRYEQFCAPEYENNHNAATSLPFFWCRGKECFKNSISGGTLATVSSWKQYNLFHLLEILGHPQLTETPAGYQPSSIIRAFISLLNRACQIVSRLSCRECGHLMYPSGKTIFNRYNYFACCNPSCKEYNIPVYLNYCNKCKKGLIDSRDNARCPNDWYICPTCLGCCNDDVIERQIQKYIVSSRPVPFRLMEMRGRGHNDKSIYYCPSCGEKLNKQTIMDHDEEKTVLVCPRCGYRKTIDLFS